MDYLSATDTLRACIAMCKGQLSEQQIVPMLGRLTELLVATGKTEEARAVDAEKELLVAQLKAVEEGAAGN